MSGENNTIESTIAEAVKAKVQTMVVEALGDPAALVRQLVSEALTMKVKDREYPYKEEPTIHKIARKAIVQAAEEAMREFIVEQTPAIKAELKKRIQADRESIASALIESLTKVAGSTYSLRVTFQERER